MPKVTKIVVQQRDKNRVSLFVDEKYSFSLSVNQMLEHKLVSGTELSEADITRFKKISTDGKLYDRVLDKLSRRQHSIKEIRIYLNQKDAEDELIDSIVKKLVDKGYLNDQLFAETWIKNRREIKKRSSRMLRSELAQKGIGSQIIDNLLSDTKEDEQTALKHLIIKKQKISRYKDDKKLIQYLLGKGFNYEDIKKTLEEGN